MLEPREWYEARRKTGGLRCTGKVNGKRCPSLSAWLADPADQRKGPYCGEEPCSSARLRKNPVYTASQMADTIDKQLLEELRAKGATEIAFHPNGALASVKFGLVASEGEGQHDDTPAPRGVRRRPGIVPRADESPQ